jgi:hypothetical protein
MSFSENYMYTLIFFGKLLDVLFSSAMSANFEIL